MKIASKVSLRISITKSNNPERCRARTEGNSAVLRYRDRANKKRRFANENTKPSWRQLRAYIFHTPFSDWRFISWHVRGWEIKGALVWMKRRT